MNVRRHSYGSVEGGDGRMVESLVAVRVADGNDSQKSQLVDLAYTTQHSQSSINDGRFKGSLVLSEGRRHKSAALYDTLAIGALILLWWAVCAEFNLNARLACIHTPAPYTIAAFQLSACLVFYIPAWALKVKTRPQYHSFAIFVRVMGPQGLCCVLLHVGALLSISAGAVSFCHIVKAAEPVLTSLLTIVVIGKFFSWQTYATIVPILLGVSAASISSLSFSWYAFGTAMVSNLGGSLRSVYAKSTMQTPNKIGRNLDSSNIYASMSIFAAIASFAIAFSVEGLTFFQQFGATADLETTSMAFVYFRFINSCVLFWLFTELAFMTLSKVDALTYSVANTMKRLYIIGYSVLMVEKQLSLTSWIGAAVAVVGTCLFSVCKQIYG
eukprot:Lankesteria_metandrocarpae@DN2855_c0_g1_i1.p1